MGIEIDKRYNPHKHEREIYSLWEKSGYFIPERIGGTEPFVITIPPPNVTDILHLGHALNNSIQDLLIRYKRMNGYRTLWVPGTDHAGIATQHMVEAELARKNIRKEDLGREKFIEYVWRYREEKGGVILEQLKEIGCSCDWTRTRFTLDEQLSRAVREAFCTLYEEGLIYRGKYIINWCPNCGTALANDEVEHEETDGKLFYILYPFVDSEGGIIVATTRPETMLGDTAVAVHPKDERYKSYVGKFVHLPLTNRKIPIIADNSVDRAFGSGAVKVTPAHDPVDFEIARRHNLPEIYVIGPHGKMTKEAGEAFEGLDRYEARKKVIEELGRQNLLVKTEPYHYSVGHCYRCHSVIEPYLSTQWFVRMKPLATPAIAAVKRGLIKFYPERWTGVYLNWMENIQDWCISRQIWWGHSLPVWWCRECGKETVSRTTPIRCSHCNSENIFQDPEVLDTWFSSWLWPFSTLGWPDITDDIIKYYPTDILVTAPEIIFFWVARMIMASLHFMGEIPFSKVLIHGTVRDELGRKMSKSLGNGIDPLLVVQEYGRDPLRFTLLAQAASGQDLFISLKSFEFGRNFVNKLWNASRLILMNIDDKYRFNELLDPPYENLLDRYILSRLEHAKKETRRSIDELRINDYISTLYHFFWHEFCDWYLEGVKERLKEPGDKKVRGLLLYILSEVLKLLHPAIPFVTEELWQLLREKVIVGLEPESIIIAPLSKEMPEYVDPEAEDTFNLIEQVSTSVRALRHFYGLPPKTKLTLFAFTPDVHKQKTLEENKNYLLLYAGVSELVMRDRNIEHPLEIVSDVEIDLPIEKFVDIAKEKHRVTKELEEISKIKEAINRKLSNEEFLSKAPEGVVNAEKERLKKLAEKEEKFRAYLELLNQKEKEV